MNSLSKLSNLKNIKASNLIRKNFCAVAKVNQMNLQVNNFNFFKFFFKFFIIFQSNETYNKLVQRDFSYFDKLANQNGRENVMVELENIKQNLDLSTKLGREVLEFSNQMTQKIVLHERTIEE